MIRSERLNYRILTEHDFNLFYEINSDEDVMRFAYLDKIKTPDEAKNSFKNVLAMQSDNNGAQFIASLQNSNIDIGIVDYEVLIKNENSGIFEMGYFIKHDYWGYGYGTEMAKAIIQYLFRYYNIHKIVASCNANNPSSENIMKKIGMEYEGTFKKTRYKNGAWDDEIKYGLLREEWEKLATQL